ncbi:MULTISPECIES: hypothetical protein [unclassified Bifidobacterium]|uniref:hypothetical protein n=1 Tax=unclassified Bifidobacterium TaxID=2608897 RepID=UPI001C6128C8|nr:MULTISPECIES: hypothetical protein [unclassified Bifidobacterium]
MKKLITFVLCVATAFFAMMPLSANAQENRSVSADMQDAISVIENELAANGTDVETELKQARKMYVDALSSSEVENSEKIRIQSIIDAIDVQISEYSLYKKPLNATYAGFHPVYTPAVAAVNAYFQMQGYRLSFELLTHAASNNSLNNTYYPLKANAARVSSSPVFTRIKRSGASRGSDIFPNSGSVEQRDLYYAIHKFTWSKLAGRVTIRDRYDFSYNDRYSGIAGVAINVMYEAQLGGYLIPYYVVIAR